MTQYDAEAEMRRGQLGVGGKRATVALRRGLRLSTQLVHVTKPEMGLVQIRRKAGRLAEMQEGAIELACLPT